MSPVSVVFEKEGKKWKLQLEDGNCLKQLMSD